MPGLKKLLLVLCASFSGAVFAQHYQIRNYSVKEGVGQSQVFALCQDQDGYLWMGTRGGGLTRFDGTEFKHFTTKNGLASNYIDCIKADEKGQLWVATNAGISKWDGNDFTNYYPLDKKQSIEVLEFCFGPDHRIYLATLSGLFAFDGEKFWLLSEANAPVNSLTIDNKGFIWFGNAHGLYQYDIKTGRTQFFLKKKYINKVFCDAKGKIWVGTYGDGIYTGGAKGFRPFMPIRSIGYQEIYEIYQDPKGHLWFGTLNRGIYSYDTLGKSFLHIQESDGLSNNHVRSIICDREGNYWFGTSGGGVCQYFGLPFTHYDRQSGLNGNFIYSVFVDSKKRLWVGAGEGGVTLLDSGKFKSFGAKEGFANTKVKAIQEDDLGNIYLGTEGNGLYVYDGKEFTFIKALRKKFIRAICKDRNGVLWIATAGLGLYRVERGEKNPENLIIKNYTVDEGMLSNRLSAVLEDNNKMLWYATENQGIGVWDNTKPMNIYQGMHVSYPLNNVRCLAMDKYGYVWAGTGGDGIARMSLKNGKVAAEKNGFNNLLTSLNVYLLAFDKKGNLFVGSESGLDYLELDKNRNPVSIRRFGKNEGFVGIETCQNAVAADPSGNLWFGTVNGLTLCDPSAFTKNLVPPVIGIAGVRLFYKEIALTDHAGYVVDWGGNKSLELPYNQNHLTFDLRGISLSNPEQVAFTWKLKNFDAQWSPESGQKSVTYSNLPPGQYVFVVKARNGDGVWSSTPLEVSITIEAPYWETWWFRGGVAALLVGIVWLVFRIRVRNLQKKATRAETQLRLDKKLADLEHQALRLQMNPHFIFNALNSIQSQIGQENEQKARYYLAKFGRLMRQILDNSRKPFITLKEEMESLENYLLVEKFSSGDNFDYEIVKPDDLDTDFIKIPPMLLQPFIENSIKHGFKNLKERRGKIELDFEEKDHLLVCTIKDNGVGRELANRRAGSEGESYHESTALKVIKERLQLMDNVTGEPYMHIKDLFDENKQPAGTQIEVGIPIL